MKKAIFFVAALIGMATASAQTNDFNNAVLYNNTYHSVRVHYGNWDLKTNPKLNLNSVNSGGASFVKGWVSRHQIPLFFETGAGFSFTAGDLFRHEDYGWGEKIGINALSIEAPFNLGFKIDFDNSFAIMPYAGLTARINLMGEVEWEYKDRYGKNEEDEDLRFFQLGYQVGAMAVYNQITFGLSYGVDFNDIYREDGDTAKNRIVKVSVGYNF